MRPSETAVNGSKPAKPTVDFPLSRTPQSDGQKRLAASCITSGTGDAPEFPLLSGRESRPTFWLKAYRGLPLPGVKGVDDKYPYTRPERPKKPRPDFLLFPHASGSWAKKGQHRSHYFDRGTM